MRARIPEHFVRSFVKKLRLGDSGSGLVQPTYPKQIIKGSSVALDRIVYSVGIQATIYPSESNLIETRMKQFTKLSYKEPMYLSISKGFIPKWNQLLPNCTETSAKPSAKPQKATKLKSFQLSLLNLSEFTITGLPTGFDTSPTSVSGLRAHIKQISRTHGKAVWDRSPEGLAGKWRIPLGAYQAIYAFLRSDPMTTVDGIPDIQLKIASIGRARLEKGYPPVEKLQAHGVPLHLAHALAPFQRGGVEFVIEKEGRALIADDMGLGKTVQAIASMTVYEKEWPVLVLCPSTARYHWRSEFLHWLGDSSATNIIPGANRVEHTQQESPLLTLPSIPTTATLQSPDPLQISKGMLEKSQVHVLCSAKDPNFSEKSTRVVVCSYGLALNLILCGRIRKGQFKCIIVDESHMLKNKDTKRTSTLIPILHAATRLILLSGTPAFAHPMELWPQLHVLQTERYGWWQDEASFFSDYVKKGSTCKRAELHTLLTGTVMIRRMKHAILKSLSAKIRERVVVEVSNPTMRKDFQTCMQILRKGKGTMGHLARKHAKGGETANEWSKIALPRAQLEDNSNKNEKQALGLFAARKEYNHDEEERHSKGLQGIKHNDNSTGKVSKAIPPECTHSCSNEPEKHTITQKTVLSYMYSLTAKAKVPEVVRLLKHWLNDKTKGKLCIFAHHIFVLDALASGAGLSNSKDSSTRFIRIDGSTTPRHRQNLIDTFQNDPTVRIALLGITAAGVAVTLTASSTVWFAELFWTPALMIQAEDRCHRIGQLAQVRCVYIVAKGTLDEVLWELIKKKFQDLGEFVEGKEKMKMVVHRTYTSGNYHTSEHTEESHVSEPKDDPSALSSIFHLKEVSHSIQLDIEEFGRTEQFTMQPCMSDEEIETNMRCNNENVKLNQKISANVPDHEASFGRTEKSAICLADEEGVLSNLEPMVSEDVQGHKTRFNLSKPLPRLRLYKMQFRGPKYGLKVVLYRGRIIIKDKDLARVSQLGVGVKPNVGDIIVAVNGLPIPLSATLMQVLQLLQRAITNPPTEIMFAEEIGFSEHFKPIVRMNMNEKDHLSCSKSHHSTIIQNRMKRVLNTTENAISVKKATSGEQHRDLGDFSCGVINLLEDD